MMHQSRIRLTTSCHDTDNIPKVPNAGQVEEKNGLKYQVMHNGVKVIYGGYHGTWMAEIIDRLRGHHEPQEEKVFHEVLKYVPEGGTMIELGSYWAYYSAWFVNSIRCANTYMIEPNRDKLIVGLNNFALNGMSGTFINAFVGKFYSKRESFIDWDGKQIYLPQVSIDNFVQTQNIPHIDILHSDIQGAELDMLYGCEKSFEESRINFLFISTHGDNHFPCYNLIEKYGFTIIASHTPDESFSVDGLIVAHSPAITGILHIHISKNKKSYFQTLS